MPRKKKQDKLPLSDFAVRMKKLRLAFGLTQEQFSARIDVPRSRSAGWETDDTFIRHPEIIKIKKEFGVDADYIIDGSTDGLPRHIYDFLMKKGAL